MKIVGLSHCFTVFVCLLAVGCASHPGSALSTAVPTLLNPVPTPSLAPSPAPETLTSTAGVTFTRITDPTILARLGSEVWQVGKLLWGNTVVNNEMNHFAAMRYCAERSARLPTRAEWIQLREAMGAAPGTPDESQPEGYVPQILPNLDYVFWSSSVRMVHYPYGTFPTGIDRNGQHASVFFGRLGNGEVYDLYLGDNDFQSVRCVVSVQ